MEIRRLTVDDVPAAVRLSTQAGWNQLSEDWRRLLDIAPEQCYAGWIDDQLVATATVVSYGNNVAWIGMVLVDKRYRKQGHGSQIFRYALDTALERDLHVGLDATDAGRAVYSQVGFSTVASIERWDGTLDSHQPAKTTTIQPIQIEDACEIDCAACGVDRSDLLKRMLDEPDTTGFVNDIDGNSNGYTIVRPGRKRWQVGPLIAEDKHTAGQLLEAVSEYLGESKVIVDILANSTTVEVFKQRGFTPQRSLKRMTWNDPRPLLIGDQVVATAGFELG